jgi:hypothetical protein
VNAALRVLRIIWAAMLFSIVVYGFIGYGAPKREQPAPTIFYCLMIISVACVGSVSFFRRKFVLPSDSTLATQPENPSALGRWRAGYIFMWALCEAIVLYGLVLRLIGFAFVQVLPFLVGGFVLMLFFPPRRPVETR